MEKFSNIFVDCTSEGTKISKEEYMKEGKSIIIDQGMNKIAGYTNRENGLYTDVPAIIFGDHTRIIKYIDKPFFLGADGVKLLKAKDKSANYKYLYYALRNAKIPNTGYNRHFKWLKEVQINYPNKEKQKEIVEILDTVSIIIQNQKLELKLLDDLIRSRFIELFGDPMTNPYNLPKVILGSVLTIEPQNGLYKPQSDYVSDGTGVPILRIDSFYDGKVSDLSSLKRLICSEAELKRYLLYENDIVINRVNSIEYLGKCGLIQDLAENTVFESNMMRLHIDENKFHPIYITKLLCSEFIYQQILGRAKKAVNQASINQKDVQSFVVYMPPIDQQNQFATFVEQTDKSKFQKYNATILSYNINVFETRRRFICKPTLII